MNRAYVICHMTMSIDGKVTGDFLGLEKCEDAIEEYYRLNRELPAQGFMCGRVTMEESFTGGWYPDLGKYEGVKFDRSDFIADNDAERYAAAVDRFGKLGWKTAEIDDDDPGYGGAHIIEILCEDVQDEFLAYLQETGISYIFAGRDEFEPETALMKLKELFGIDTILLEGGSIINGVFKEAGMVDELSIVQVPVMGDPDGKPMFYGSDMKGFELKNSENIAGEAKWLCFAKDEIYIEERIIIEKGELGEYFDQIVHFNNSIYCYGELTFNGCAIYYNEPDTDGKIYMYQGSKITLKDCTVICRGRDGKRFIQGEKENSVYAEGTKFIDCSDFLMVEYDCKELVISKCEFLNCCGGMFDLYLDQQGHCSIYDNVIKQEKRAAFNLYKNNSIEWYKKTVFWIGGGSSTCGMEFKNNSVTVDPAFNEDIYTGKERYDAVYYLASKYLEVTDCSFEGMSRGIDACYVRNCSFKDCDGAVLTNLDFDKKIFSYVENCTFENCMNVILTGFETRVTECRFISCRRGIIRPSSLMGGVYINDCEFKDIVLDQNRARHEFLDVFRDDACIVFARDSRPECETNGLVNCRFENVSIKDGYLIAADGYEKPFGEVGFVHNCSFTNCKTDNAQGKLIDDKSSFKNIFRKNIVVEVIRIS
ncbi:MAG: hypothetical protein E7228_06945 [Clostridiales bacterium]|nr:hypothetical protein [Clostridiales bacterium]